MLLIILILIILNLFITFQFILLFNVSFTPQCRADIKDNEHSKEHPIFLNIIIDLCFSFNGQRLVIRTFRHIISQYYRATTRYI